MRKSRFSDEQIVPILREADRTSVAEAAKKNKVSEQTIYIWRKHFAGLAPNDVKRLKALELARREAQVIIEAWRRHYNGVRPHSSIGYLTPFEFKRQHRPVNDQSNRAVFQE
jgi:putative transposase